jgi:hypothetical protein
MLDFSTLTSNKMSTELIANELLNLLNRRARVMTKEQIVQTYFRRNVSEAEKWLSLLEGQGLVERRCVLARPILLIEAPVVRWNPGDQKPDFGKVAYRLKTRWTKPAKPTQIVFATKTASDRIGGYFGGRPPRASEYTHDVNLAEVFLWHLKHRPGDAAGWIPEAKLYSEGRGLKERLPDAVIRSGVQEVRVIEFGGSYKKHKLIDFHSQMSELPYEIW